MSRICGLPLTLRLHMTRFPCRPNHHIVWFQTCDSGIYWRCNPVAVRRIAERCEIPSAIQCTSEAKNDPSSKLQSLARQSLPSDARFPWMESIYFTMSKAACSSFRSNVIRLRSSKIASTPPRKTIAANLSVLHDLTSISDLPSELIF